MILLRDKEREKLVREENKKRKEFSRCVFMKASHSIHLLMECKYPEGKVDICRIWYETDDYYIGYWSIGFGFIDVLFPKATTRLLTEEEKTTDLIREHSTIPAYKKGEGEEKVEQEKISEHQ